MAENGDKAFRPLVSPETDMKEFTFRALILGLFMTVILGSANAYLGLRAGMTIAATYPAAVVGMAILRLFRGTILEENFARTVGSIGESVAAGAIFTIPAFVIARLWVNFGDLETYLLSSAMMFTGGILGILFVSVLRRVMVEDVDLPFPESTAAAEIHKAGRTGGSDAKLLFSFIGIGGLVQILGKLAFFETVKGHIIGLGKTTVSLFTGKWMTISQLKVGATTVFSTPEVAPAYMGVGYIIGPRLAALNFAGGLLAWGLFVPLVTYFMGPHLEPLIGSNVGLGDSHPEIWPMISHILPKWLFDPSPFDFYWAKFLQGLPTWMTYRPQETVSWTMLAVAIWKFIVRPIAVGGMLVGAGYTLYRMRKNLGRGVTRAVSDIRKATGFSSILRTDRDIHPKITLLGVLVVTVLMVGLYWVFCSNWGGAIVAAIVMVVTGFFFAAVSGNLVGTIGSSNNPVSGLTLSTLIIAALLMVAIGVEGDAGIAAVLGVAAVICTSSAVAGEMLQDLKVGHILGGTPWKMELGDIIGVFFAGVLLFFPLVILHQGDIAMGGEGFGGKSLPAPQGGLMAMLASGIVGGNMAWTLVVVGIVFGFGMILVQVRSPMLVAVGMYLPLETSFAIFVGGCFKWLCDQIGKRLGYNEPQMTRVGNAGILVSAGLIAGEALMGLFIAALAFFEIRLPSVFDEPSWIVGMIVMLAIGLIMVLVPLKRAGRPDEAPPPTAVV